MAGIVGEIGVHLEKHVVPAFEAPPEAVEISGAEPELAAAVKHMNPLAALCEPVGDVARPIRRSVVNHEHVQTLILLENQRDETREIVPFVEGRYDDEATLQSKNRSGAWRNCYRMIGSAILWDGRRARNRL